MNHDFKGGKLRFSWLIEGSGLVCLTTKAYHLDVIPEEGSSAADTPDPRIPQIQIASSESHSLNRESTCKFINDASENI
ncbi:uncharacterized protein H6S33_002826 [Morchella sextelata]|uniref:uncharacterized protein n=1 Tax=Morchella sextelata TaxID=1174677 RepID=UPI001D059EB1|nr:uncharacterized protein H6S33_002826 [Morchella sextelata]KAH0607792.1 hypothetical protein H6S33_002826 [Morchella sextelata]